MINNKKIIWRTSLKKFKTTIKVICIIIKKELQNDIVNYLLKNN